MVTKTKAKLFICGGSLFVKKKLLKVLNPISITPEFSKVMNSDLAEAHRIESGKVPRERPITSITRRFSRNSHLRPILYY